MFYHSILFLMFMFRFITLKHVISIRDQIKQLGFINPIMCLTKSDFKPKHAI